MELISFHRTSLIDVCTPLLHSQTDVIFQGDPWQKGIPPFSRGVGYRCTVTPNRGRLQQEDVALRYVYRCRNR